MNALIIFGSAVSKRFRPGQGEPKDIDVLYTGEFEYHSQNLIDDWSIREYGKKLPIDLHQVIPCGNIIDVPVLDDGTEEYIVLEGDADYTIRPHVRRDGFASILRLYGNSCNEFVNYMTYNPIEKLSLLPRDSYQGENNGFNMDKYYSGVQAFRNAASHATDLNNILDLLNCGSILRRLLQEDPINWKSSLESDDEKRYGDGWSWAHTLRVSLNKNEPAFLNSSERLNENEGFELIWRKEK